jgi:hypothetical protein
MTFIEAIKKGDASNATTLIETVLNRKTLAYIKEQKAVVSKGVYGDSDLLDESAHPWEDELTSRGYKKTGFERVPGQVYKGVIAHHKFTHPDGHKITLTNSRGNDLHGFLASNGSGSSKSQLISHLKKVHGMEKE